MNFTASEFLQHQISDLRDYYLAFGDLTSLLHHLRRKACPPDVNSRYLSLEISPQDTGEEDSDFLLLQSHLHSPRTWGADVSHVDFFKLLRTELRRLHAFYSSAQRQVDLEWNDLQHRSDELFQHSSANHHAPSSSSPDAPRLQQAHSSLLLKRSSDVRHIEQTFCQVYRSQRMLLNFVKWNYVALDQLLIQYDACFGTQIRDSLTSLSRVSGASQSPATAKSDSTSIDLTFSQESKAHLSIPPIRLPTPDTNTSALTAQFPSSSASLPSSSSASSISPTAIDSSSTASFFASQSLMRAKLGQLVDLHARCVCGGDRQRAHDRLRGFIADDENESLYWPTNTMSISEIAVNVPFTSHSSMLSLGLQIGCLLPLFCLILALMMDAPDKVNVNFTSSNDVLQPTSGSNATSKTLTPSTSSTMTSVALNVLFRLSAVPLYRAGFALLALGWMWVGCLYIFHNQYIQLALTLRLRSPLRLGHTRAARSMVWASLLYAINLLVYLWLIERVSTSTLVSTTFYRLFAAFLPVSLLILLVVHLIFSYQRYKHELDDEIASATEGKRNGDDDGNARAMVLVLEAIGHSVIAPFGRLTFRDGLVADVLTSMVKVLADLERVLCFFLSGSWSKSALLSFPSTASSTFTAKLDPPRCEAINHVLVPLLMVLPLCFRFLQCLRAYYDSRFVDSSREHERRAHFGNAIKYLLAIIAVLLGVFHPAYTVTSQHDWNWHRYVWLLCCVMSAIYSFYWDVVVDWGLTLPFNQSGPGLRKLVYPSWVYHTIMWINLFLRFAWTMSILPARFNPYWTATTHKAMFDDWQYEILFLPSLVLAELARRMLWLLLRVENEHVRLWQRFVSYQYAFLYFRPTAHAAPQLMHVRPSSSEVATDSADVMALEGHDDSHNLHQQHSESCVSSISPSTLEFIVVVSLFVICGVLIDLW